MKYKIFLFTFSLFLLFFSGIFQKVSACSCLSNSSCEMYYKANAVFVGKIVDSSNQRTDEDRSGYNRSANTNFSLPPKQITYAFGKIIFEIEEAFTGTKKDSRFTLESINSTCDFNFQADKTYLVYAFKNKDGSFLTNICTPTNLLENAGKDLDFLRNPPKDGSGSKIFGTVYESINNYSEENLSVKPMKGLEVKIISTTNPKSVFFAITNEEGKYETNVPVGTYEVKPNIPNYYKYEVSLYSNPNTEIIKAEDRQCKELTFTIKNDSKVSGKILDEDGKPAKDITIEIFPENTERDLNARGKWAFSDEKGNFSFSGISLGRYFLSVNYYKMPDDKMPYSRIFYPFSTEQSQAQIFEITNGTKHTDIIFRLPPKLKKRRITGRITWSDGSPAVKADVKLMDKEFNSTDYFKDIKIDESGKFVLEGFEGREYFIRAIVWEPINESSNKSVAQAESEVFILNSTTTDINLIFDENIPQFEPSDEPNIFLSTLSFVYNRMFRK